MPHIRLTDVRIHDAQGREALVLPSVENVLAWRSLLHADLVLHSLVIEGPRLAVRRDPVGVVAAITPFNFPVQLLSWKLCPALLAGCPVICKPDPRTPLASARLAQWASELGLPPGVFSVLHGDGATGAALVEHAGVAKVAFTGSVPAGRAVYRSAADGISHTETAVNAAAFAGFRPPSSAAMSLKVLPAPRKCRICSSPSGLSL